MFDSLKYAKILEEAGLPREQAETHIRILRDVIGEEMATKQDLHIGLSDLNQDIKGEFSEVRTEFIDFKQEMRTEFAGFKQEMTSEFTLLRTEFTDFKQEVKAEFADVRKDIQNVKHSIITLEHRLTVKLGGLMIAIMTLAITANQLLNN